MKISKLTTIKFLLLFSFFFFLGIGHLFAQNESDERSLLDVNSGISFSKDSLFRLNLRFRMQNRVGFKTESGEDLDIDQIDFRVRRMRLRLDGYVLSEKLQYYIQLGFTKSDLDLEVGDFAQPIRDAIIYYYPNPNLYFGFGQSKLPGNRERVISSGNLQFADRSIANGIFTLDRDFGFFGYYTVPAKGISEVQMKAAISSGEGRNTSFGVRGLSYTGRVEYLPFGAFKNSGDYSQGDLEFEPKPKLSFGFTYNWNQNATRSRGQLGPLLFENRDQQVLIADGMFKFAGWGLLVEYFERDSFNPITRNSQGQEIAVWIGKGANFQLSKMISRNSEFAIRYAYVNPDDLVSNLEKKVKKRFWDLQNISMGIGSRFRQMWAMLGEMESSYYPTQTISGLRLFR